MFRLTTLLHDIACDRNAKTIIFVETKRKVEDITRSIRGFGYPAVCMHGDKSQQDRDYVLREFRNGNSNILVATDVAARGLENFEAISPFYVVICSLGCLDVEGIKFVINFDYPNSSEDYIHRIGRTGRNQASGTSYAFFTQSNSRQAKDLVNVLREANQSVNPKLDEMANRGGFGGGGRSKSNSDMSSNRSRPSRFTSASEAPQSAALQLASSLVQNMYTSPPPSVLFLSQPPPPPPSNSFGNHFGQRQAVQH
uniref:Helicase C-terminal domain-containing protein n=1 Tax=Timema douglasi TaxID=61478 RepID=A0A7R8VH59_TIMDO|nr:unnamed protein product [Timema douglasi]